MIEKKQLFSLLLLVSYVVFLPPECGASDIETKNALYVETSHSVHGQNTSQGQRPAWTLERPFFEDKNGLHFIGSYMGGAHYRLTLRLAKSEAIKEVLESVQIKARSEFSSAIHGQNINIDDLGQYVTDAVAWVIDNINVRGIRQSKTYHEQIFDPVSRLYKHNAWVQLEIPRADYVKAKIEAGQKILDKAVREEDEEAKEKAHELLKKLRQDT